MAAHNELGGCQVILRKILGYLLVVGAVAGFIFGAVGLIAIWRYQPGVTQTVVDTLDLMDRTVNASQNGLVIVGDVLQITTVDVASLQTTIDALAQTVHSSSPMLDSLTNLTGKDFPAALNATQTSLASAQGSALLIDNVLGALTSLPFHRLLHTNRLFPYTQP